VQAEEPEKEAKGAVAVANAIKDMGALTQLDVSGNSLGRLVPPEGWEVHDDGKHYRQHGGAWSTTVPAGSQPLGIIAIANAIPDMGAISSVNLLMNNILLEQAKVLANILKEHPTLKSLCGNRGNETELDMSGKTLGAEGAIMLAPEIAGNGAISSLNLAKNSLTKNGALSICDALLGSSRYSNCIQLTTN
jgi:hypothetical protein